MKEKTFRLFSRAALALLMMMLTTTSAWAWSGSGDTADDPYLITSASDLIQLATDVNGGETYNKKYFLQTAPITLTSAWTPIGTSAHPFKGHYNGGGYAIRGLQVAGNYQYAGLFGYITSDLEGGSLISTELKNINIVDCTINVGSVSGSKAGAIAAYTGPVHLTNCRVSGSITAYNTASGLVGLANQTYGNSVTNCFVDVTVSATGNQYNQYIYPTVRLMLSVLSNTPSASGNYYHDNGGGVTVGCSATPLYTISAPSGLTVAATNAMLTFNATPYFAGGATASLTVDDADKAIKTLTATGAASSSVAANKKSATVTLGSSDVTVSTTLMDLTGTVNGVTWSMSDTDSNGTYDRLTLSGNGTLSSSPWTTNFAASITRVDVTSANINISGNPFSSLGNGAVIVVPTPAYAVSYASAAFASKLRVAFGSYLFLATNEGGTAAYKIASEQDLRNLASVINADNNEFGTGKTFRQTQDITMSATAFTPIGNNLFFEGTYDGGNHTITSLNVTNTNAWAGLIARLNGTAKNIILVSPTVSCTCGSQAVVGAVAGTASNNATITNCRVINPTVTATANSNVHIGAIIGKTHSISSMSDCYFYDSDAASHNYTAVGDKTDQGSKITRVYAAHLVTPADASVTIQTAMAADLGFTYSANNYWREGAELTLSNTLGETPEYYTLNYTATAGTINGSTLTVGSDDATVSAAIRSDRQNHSITYMKADGTTDTHDAIALDETMTSLQKNKWYFVGKDINYTQTISTESGNGSVTIILCDGKTMSIGTDANHRHNGAGITLGAYSSTLPLNIYGQSLDDATAGHLNIYTIGSTSGGLLLGTGSYTQNSGNVTIDVQGGSASAINTSGSITLNGGKLFVTTNNHHTIYGSNQGSYNGSIVINGGKLDAIYTGSYFNRYALRAFDDITLGWTNATDHITATRYSANGTVKIAEGKMLVDADDDSNYYIGDGNALSSSAISAIAGKTLKPALLLADNADKSAQINALSDLRTTAILQGRTLYKDGYWNTLVLPFDVTIASSPLAGDNVVAKVLNESSKLDNGTLTLNFDNAPAKIPAGTPFIIKWDNTGVNLVNPVFTGVTIDNTNRDVNFTDGSGSFMGTYAPLEITDANRSKVLLLSGNNKLGYAKTDRTIANGKALGTCRAYFYFPGSQTARSFVMNFGDDDTQTTGIVHTEITESTEMADAIYDLQGRRIEKPKKGLYIHGGKKVLVH